MPLKTRRKFLCDCSAMAVAALAAPKMILAGAALPARSWKSLRDVSFEDFAAQLKTTFRVCTGGGEFIEVKLERARPAAEERLRPGQRPAGDAGNEKFSLVFAGRRRELIGQDTYTFEHDALGRFDLFIVPIHTRDPRAIDYEAVFNRRPRSSF